MVELPAVVSRNEMVPVGDEDVVFPSPTTDAVRE
jgi:hypothetical protein